MSDDDEPIPKVEELMQMSGDELEATRFRAQDQADRIEHQLDMAGAEKNATGEYADPVWYVQAKHALRCRRTRISQIGRILNIMEKREEALK